MEKPQHKKLIQFDTTFVNELECLCEIKQTNLTVKVKELLHEWKIQEVNRLREIAPELYEKYLEAIKCK